MSDETTSPVTSARQVRRLLELTSGLRVESVRREPNTEGRLLWRVASRDAAGTPRIGIVNDEVIAEALATVQGALTPPA